MEKLWAGRTDGVINKIADDFNSSIRILYGVTMPQRGISQAIELNVNEIEGKQRELLDGVL